MKYILTILIILCQTLYASEIDLPTSIKPGDIISSETLTEGFAEIKRARKVFNENDLLGTWLSEGFMDPLPLADAHWASTGSLFKSTKSLITFSSSASGYILQSSSPTSLHTGTSFTQTAYAVKGDVLFFLSESIAVAYSISKLSKNILKLSILENKSGRIPLLFLTKTNLPPNAPTNLTAIVQTTSPFNVDLSWTDNSTSETGFMITRKTTLAGEFIALTTTPANTTTYTDTVTSGGDYWYRVHATSDVGNSVGSNVAKVTVDYPLTPAIFQAVAVNKVITLAWSNEATLISGATGYNIYRKKVIDASFTLIASPAISVITHTDTLTTNGVYHYRIQTMQGSTIIGQNELRLVVR